jgi:hypothetical protein
MVPTEAILASLAALSTVASALFGGGLFRQALKHNGEMAVQRYRQEQTDTKVKENDIAIQSLKQDMALVNKDVAGFQQHIRKLDLLPEIMSKLSEIGATIGFMKEQINRLDAHDRSDRSDKKN